MKAVFYFILSSFLVDIEASKQKSVNLALETVLEFNNTDQKTNFEIINGVQNLLDNVKNDIQTKVSRRSLSEKLKFTDFIENVLIILKTYSDEDLEKVFDILADELRKYHYKGCKFHELTEKHAFRRFVSNKLEEVKKMSPKKLRKCLEDLLNTLQNRVHNRKHIEFLTFLNSLYGVESTHKLASLLKNLLQYRSNTRRSYMDLLSVVKDGLRSVIFDHYSKLNINARQEIKLRLETYWTDHQNNKLNHQIVDIDAGALAGITSSTVKTTRDRPRNEKVYYHPPVGPNPIYVEPVQKEELKEHHNSNKKRQDTKKKRHRYKERITTEGIYETERHFETLMTLYPEKIKRKEKKKHSRHKSTTPTNGVHLSLRKGVRNTSYSNRLQKPNILKTHKKPLQLRSQKYLRTNQDLDKNNEKKNDNVKYSNEYNVQSQESGNYEPTSRQRLMVEDMHRYATKKLTYQSRGKVTPYNRGFERNEDSSVEIQKAMSFRNMKSNEGMSIEGFKEHTAPSRIFYRRILKNNSFENENVETEESITLQPSALDQSVIKRIDNLERELEDVKTKIYTQSEKLKKENVSFTFRAVNEDENTTMLSELDSNESKDKDYITANIDESVHSTEITTVTHESPKSRFNIKTTELLTSPTTTAVSTTVNIESATEKETKDEQVDLSADSTQINEARKKKPNVVIKKSEFFVNSTIPVNFGETKGNITDEKIINEETDYSNLRKTGMLLNKGIDDKTETTPKSMSRVDFEKVFINSSREIYEDKPRLIKENLQADLKKISGDAADVQLNLNDHVGTSVNVTFGKNF